MHPLFSDALGVSSAPIETLAPMMHVLGLLASAGAALASLFVFWNRIGRRPAGDGLLFLRFTLIVAILAALLMSAMLGYWWYFATAAVALPALHLARQTVRARFTKRPI